MSQKVIWGHIFQPLAHTLSPGFSLLHKLLLSYGSVVNLTTKRGFRGGSQPSVSWRIQVLDGTWGMPWVGIFWHFIWSVSIPSWPNCASLFFYLSNTLKKSSSLYIMALHRKKIPQTRPIHRSEAQGRSSLWLIHMGVSPAILFLLGCGLHF
jgi:hypothetical protein